VATKKIRRTIYATACGIGNTPQQEEIVRVRKRAILTNRLILYGELAKNKIAKISV